MTYFGKPYLHYILDDLFANLEKNNLLLEVDPYKLQHLKEEDIEKTLKKNWKDLLNITEDLLKKLISSNEKLPL
jgi:hypothetical protein